MCSRFLTEVRYVPFLLGMARTKSAPDQNEIETAGLKMGKGQDILQDRKAVLDAVPDEPLPGAEKLVIEFLTPQTVKSESAPCACEPPSYVAVNLYAPKLIFQWISWFSNHCTT